MGAKRCVLAGGSGFLGSALSEELVRNGFEVVILTRSPSNHNDKVRQVFWDGKNLADWITTFDGAEAVFNLTGKSVICRYTPENREEIVSSRVNSVKVISDAIE